MMEDVIENEKYEGMKKQLKIEPNGNGEDNNRRKMHVINLLSSRTPKEDRGYRPDSNHHFSDIDGRSQTLAKVTNQKQ